ncbi:peptidase U61 LD-carboxypeptidase A [Scytonema sp. HK-05]|uniref:S66 peptidase family protein n=1 Tax=Scytonema sp. HK-05 TaxID=1137095 RepID=UPI0009360F1F|nr:LD-carboxypeptidase [Scytonema sp. HK-05]OKH51662.1 LD-carboxypeptidase [Scytonema sp. HK-05]BAY49899.1 peptidase U61 LD-carboxypeptidase A [Scytonema sp. HK-05]
MINRRNLLIALAATSWVFASEQNLVRAASHKPLLKPKRLQPGSVVGIVSPAGATFIREELNIVIDAVKGLGLVPRLAPHLLERYGYLAGKDKDRAADINQFFSDSSVAAILPIRGGWGCSRMLPYLDYQRIRQNPKILVGFSDITALILGLNAQTNLVTFHGPNGLSSWRTTQTDYFRRVLFSGETVTFQNQKDGDDSDRLMQVKYRVQTITSGKAKGRLIGGNLSVLSAIVGSPYLPNLNGAILFLEDTHENIYRIDRMMTHLKIAGLFDKLAGFVFGQCSDCSPDADYASLTLEEVLWDHIKPLGIPAYNGAMIGHIENVLTLPIGLQVEIDADAGTIRMLEPAVQ